MTSFKFDAQSAFLTYAQSNLTWTEIADHLRSIGDIDWARICQELHTDGGHHQHVVVRWTKRVQSRNARLFDVATNHPNIQPVRSIKHALAYVSKDGQFTDIGTVPCSSTITDWVAAATTMDEAAYYSAACTARIGFQYAQKFWSLAARTEHTIQETYEADLARESERLNLTSLSFGSTIVMGPTGVGKTSWAKRVAPKPALWVRHIDVLRAFKCGFHKSVIFDDMSFEHMPRTAQIHIVDSTDETHVHVRYGLAIIPAGITKIFTCNQYPFLTDSAIERRVTLINLYQ